MDVDGHPYTFPPLPAAVWLDVLSRPAWPYHVLTLADEASHEAFTDRAERGEAGWPELIRVAHAALSAAAGRPWWEAQRLAWTCLTGPNVTGAVLMRGVDPQGVTLAAFLAVVWVLLTQNGDDMKRAQMEMDLTMPPPEAVEEMQAQEVSMEDLVARMRQAPGVSIG